MSAAAAQELARRILTGETRALARAITLVEDGSPGHQELLKALYAHTGRASTVGVTGFAGTGKSSLVDAMTAAYRSRDRSVGIVAVDPSSAFSGGAILGDRIRMQRHTMDPGVFVRSMASRGNLGGLSKTSVDVVDLMDASGRDVVLVETVGVGQDEIEVVRATDTVLVVLVPGLGDDIQAIKAGILEIADIFVINKADREGADRVESELKAMLSLSELPEEERPRVVRTVATRGEGLDALLDAIEAHRARAGFAAECSRREREQSRSRLVTLLAERLVAAVRARCLDDAELERTVDRIVERELDPYSAVEAILERVQIESNGGSG